MKSFQQRLILFLIKKVGTKILNLLAKSYRVEIIGREYEDKLKKDYPSILYAFWHQRFLYLIYHFKNCNGRVLISYSKDGEMIAKVVESFGIVPVRGSSSRGRIGSTREIMEVLEKGHIVGIAADGPRGPIYNVKPGIIQIAKSTGMPILPVTVGAEKKWIFNSWDRFIVPKPFSRIYMKYGEPVFVEQESSDDVLEKKRKEIELRLIKITDEVDGMFYTARTHRSE